MIGSTSSYSLSCHINNLARSCEYMNWRKVFPDPDTIRDVLFSTVKYIRRGWGQFWKVCDWLFASKHLWINAGITCASSKSLQVLVGNKPLEIKLGLTSYRLVQKHWLEWRQWNYTRTPPYMHCRTQINTSCFTKHVITHWFWTSTILFACEYPKLLSCGGPECILVSSRG